MCAYVIVSINRMRRPLKILIGTCRSPRRRSCRDNKDITYGRAIMSNKNNVSEKRVVKKTVLKQNEKNLATSRATLVRVLYT